MEALYSSVGLQYKPFAHEPVHTYEAAERVRAQFNLEGAETKSLFLKGKDGRWAMFISLEGTRTDMKIAKAALGWKPSMASADDLQNVTGCEPGCAVPFGHSNEVTLLVDELTLQADNLIFSPGRPEHTLVVDQQQWQLLLNTVDNDIVMYSAESQGA